MTLGSINNDMNNNSNNNTNIKICWSLSVHKIAKPVPYCTLMHANI